MIVSHIDIDWDDIYGYECDANVKEKAEEMKARLKILIQTIEAESEEESDYHLYGV